MVRNSGLIQEDWRKVLVVLGIAGACCALYAQPDARTDYDSIAG